MIYHIISYHIISYRTPKVALAADMAGVAAASGPRFAPGPEVGHCAQPPGRHGLAGAVEGFFWVGRLALCRIVLCRIAACCFEMCFRALLCCVLS